MTILSIGSEQISFEGGRCVLLIFRLGSCDEVSGDDILWLGGGTFVDIFVDRIILWVGEEGGCSLGLVIIGDSCDEGFQSGVRGG